MALHHLAVRSARSRVSTLATGASVFSRTSIRFSSSGPATVLDTSFWRSLVPKPLRKENRSQLKQKGKEWNPATFFIVMFLFIGSMSIQMIALRSSFDRYMRQASVRIGLLREVVEKIQNGEQVDVEKVLGTGNPQKEADWEEVLRAIERDENASKTQKKSKRKQAEPKRPEPSGIQSEPERGKTKTAGNMGDFF